MSTFSLTFNVPSTISLSTVSQFEDLVDGAPYFADMTGLVPLEGHYEHYFLASPTQKLMFYIISKNCVTNKIVHLMKNFKYVQRVLDVRGNSHPEEWICKNSPFYEWGMKNMCPPRMNFSIDENGRIKLTVCSRKGMLRYYLSTQMQFHRIMFEVLHGVVYDHTHDVSKLILSIVKRNGDDAITWSQRAAPAVLDYFSSILRVDINSIDPTWYLHGYRPFVEVALLERDAMEAVISDILCKQDIMFAGMSNERIISAIRYWHTVLDRSMCPLTIIQTLPKYKDFYFLHYMANKMYNRWVNYIEELPIFCDKVSRDFPHLNVYREGSGIALDFMVSPSRLNTTCPEITRWVHRNLSIKAGEVGRCPNVFNPPISPMNEELFAKYVF